MSQQSKPTVSVCVSAYNTESYVGDAIESVLTQTLADLEVVVLDNASTDDTWAVISAFTDPRVRAVRVDQNKGASGGRAYAIDRARGDWIAVLDSDDWMATARLEHLVGLGVDSKADVVADDVFLIDDGADEPWGTLFTAGYSGIEGVERIDATTFVESDRWMKPGLRLGLTKPMFQRSFLEAHAWVRPDPGLTVVHDYWWLFDALLAGAAFSVSPVAGYYYRARSGQLVTLGIEQSTLSQQITKASTALDRPEVRADAALSAALVQSRCGWSDARAYLRFLEAVRARNLSSALSVARHHPVAVKMAFTNAPRWLRRKISHDRFTDHMTHRF